MLGVHTCVTRCHSHGQVILAVGNYLNGTSKRGGAYGFRLPALLMLSNTKTSDNSSTLLHYVASFISERLPSASSIVDEMPNLELGCVLYLRRAVC